MDPPLTAAESLPEERHEDESTDSTLTSGNGGQSKEKDQSHLGRKDLMASPAKSRAEMTEEEKAALKAEKKAKKEEEKRLKLARKDALARAADPALVDDLIAPVEYLSIANEPDRPFGIYKIVQGACGSKGSGRLFASLPTLEDRVGQTVWVRARVHKSVLTSSTLAFLRLRKALHTVQAVVTDKPTLKWLKKTLSNESVVDVQAEVVVPSAGIVESCSVKRAELAVQRIYIVSRAEDLLPLTLEDAARPLGDDPSSGTIAVRNENETQEMDDPTSSSDATAKRPTVTRDTRLDARIVDLRVPPHGSLLRLQSGVCQLFREFLTGQGFVEIHTPKLIAGASEGGAEVFKTDYFGRPACLAQSPQLYKQMAICADLSRVFEIGPVFRAEKSDTHRHLCEFTGLDFEMEIVEHFSEIVDVLDAMFVSIFDGLETRYAHEIGQVRTKWPVAPFQYRSHGEKNLRLDWPEAIAMLRDAGATIGDLEDLSTEKERLLGKLVKEKYQTDFFALMRFPANVRPFYTMLDPTEPDYTNSFDVFMRGEEILSGAQRIHDADMLVKRATAILGEEGVESIRAYVDSFRYGAWPHGGIGVGLERVVMLYLGVGNIRECSMFPRDPRRLTP